jgi:hypothetical protein
VLAASASSKTVYGGGGAVPNLTEIRIYNVSGQQDDLNGGELVQSGLNRTFLLNQSETTSYRFEFRVNNTGSARWDIESVDDLFHDGVDPSWTVSNIQYNNSTQVFPGGDFSSGRVRWTNTSGSLESDRVLNAKYVAAVDTDPSEVYDQAAVFNDTSAGTGSRDEHRLDVSHLGFINATLLDPLNDSIVKKDALFELNSSFECVSGECGNVEATPRFNSTSVADTVMPLDTGTPFNVEESRRKSCGLLGPTETCYLDWSVNATGAEDSAHLLDVNASSSLEGVQANDSVDTTVTIDLAVVASLRYDTVDFGSLEPGETDRPAAGNTGLLHNLTVFGNSVDVGSVEVNASDLESTGFDYSIGSGNITVSTQDDPSTGTSLGGGFNALPGVSTVQPGSNLTHFFFLNVPSGIAKGDYTGEIEFRASQ